jgi:hypothetical protein
MLLAQVTFLLRGSKWKRCEKESLLWRGRGGGKRSITLILDQWVVCVWYRGGCFFVSKE